MGFIASEGAFDYPNGTFEVSGWVQAWMLNLLIVGSCISLTVMFAPSLMMKGPVQIMVLGPCKVPKKKKEGENYQGAGAGGAAGEEMEEIMHPNAFSWGIRNLMLVMPILMAFLCGGKGAYITALVAQCGREFLDCVQHSVVKLNPILLGMFFPMLVLDIVCLIATANEPATWAVSAGNITITSR